MQRRTWTTIVLSACLFGCGGGSELERVEVSGTVTYKGTLIEDGAIRFVPKSGSDLPVGTAQIIQGKYSATGPAAIAVGTYGIEIKSYIEKAGAAGDMAQEPGGTMDPAMVEKEQLLPEKYNTKSEIEEFTIPAGSGPVTKDFTLEE